MLAKFTLGIVGRWGRALGNASMREDFQQQCGFDRAHGEAEETGVLEGLSFQSFGKAPGHEKAVYSGRVFRAICSFQDKV